MARITAADFARIRADTPAAADQSFLLSAGASLMPKPVVAAVIDHIRLEERVGGYAAADQQQDRLDGVYDSVARLLNAERDEIALTENATAAGLSAHTHTSRTPFVRIHPSM